MFFNRKHYTRKKMANRLRLRDLHFNLAESLFVRMFFLNNKIFICISLQLAS